MKLIGAAVAAFATTRVLTVIKDPWRAAAEIAVPASVLVSASLAASRTVRHPLARIAAGGAVLTAPATLPFALILYLTGPRYNGCPR